MWCHRHKDNQVIEPSYGEKISEQRPTRCTGKSYSGLIHMGDRTRSARKYVYVPETRPQCIPRQWHSHNRNETNQGTQYHDRNQILPNLDILFGEDAMWDKSRLEAVCGRELWHVESCFGTDVLRNYTCECDRRWHWMQTTHSAPLADTNNQLPEEKNRGKRD